MPANPVSPPFAHRRLSPRTAAAVLLPLVFGVSVFCWMWWSEKGVFGRRTPERPPPPLRAITIESANVWLNDRTAFPPQHTGPLFSISGTGFLASGLQDKPTEGVRFLDPPARPIGGGAGFDVPPFDLRRADTIRVLREGGVRVSAPPGDRTKEVRSKPGSLTASLQVEIVKENTAPVLVGKKPTPAVTLRIDWHLYREVNAPSGERRPIRLRAELLHGWVGPCRVRPEDAEAAAQYLLEESMKDLADEYRKQNGLADAASAQK